MFLTAAVEDEFLWGLSGPLILLGNISRPGGIRGGMIVCELEEDGIEREDIGEGADDFASACSFLNWNRSNVSFPNLFVVDVVVGWGSILFASVQGTF